MRPKQLLKDIGREYPNVWQTIKGFRADKGIKLPNWADWCYMPIAAGVAIATGGDNALLHAATFSPLSPAIITALASWRVSQGVYKFDADLYNALTKQPLDGNIPYEVLTRLPEWCVYIETMGNSFSGEVITGFLAHLEHDANDGRMELRLVLMMENGKNIPIPVHIGAWSIENGIAKMVEEAQKQSGINFPTLDFSNEIVPLLQLVLYLCAENADMPKRPLHPSTRTRSSGAIDAPKEPKVWHVGERIGANIRQYRNTVTESQGGTHASPRPHIRRAHWHHFWTGKKLEERNLVLRWLPPIPVNNDDEHDNPIVIHEIKE